MTGAEFDPGEEDPHNRPLDPHTIYPLPEALLEDPDSIAEDCALAHQFPHPPGPQLHPEDEEPSRQCPVSLSPFVAQKRTP